MTFSTGLVGVEVSTVSWLGQLKFKSSIIVTVGFQNFLFVAWSGLFILEFKSLLRGGVCILGDSILR